MDRPSDPLFSSFLLGSTQLDNRIVMAPMTRGFARDGVPDSRTADYYRRRAENGVGLIITEGIAPSPIGAQFAGVPYMARGPALDGWRRVAEAVHAAGGKIFAQLWHAGIRRIKAQGIEPENPSEGPTEHYPELDAARADDAERKMSGIALSNAGVRRTIQSFIDGAILAADAGFDGVELHGAHGYLLDQFFWQASNGRDDEYGGNLANRLRIGIEIVEGIKARSGLTVGLRFSEWKLPDYYDLKPFGTPADFERFLRPFVNAGIDFFHASTRRFWEPAFGSDVSLAGWTRRLSGKPTIAVGSVGLQLPISGPEPLIEPANVLDNVATARRMIEQGEFDLIAVGRALIADSLWATKIKHGRIAELAPYNLASLSELV
jgi:2,4-dienoyl-CoA reductase-like NADH-dependent reductase (Old Yellow Enzyme family)